jgi:hypothetical protein
MSSEPALNAPGWAVQKTRAQAASKAATPFPANPDRRGVDFNPPLHVKTLINHTFSGSYQLSARYLRAIHVVAKGYL